MQCSSFYCRPARPPKPRKRSVQVPHSYHFWKWTFFISHTQNQDVYHRVQSTPDHLRRVSRSPPCTDGGVPPAFLASIVSPLSSRPHLGTRTRWLTRHCSVSVSRFELRVDQQRSYKVRLRIVARVKRGPSDLGYIQVLRIPPCPRR